MTADSLTFAQGGYQKAHANIKLRWQRQWARGAEALTPTAYANEPFDVPADTAWARLTIQDGAATQASIGAPCGNNIHRHPGVIQIQVFTPAGRGSGPLNELLDKACCVFRNAIFDGIRCFEASARIAASDNTWDQGVVSVPFWRDQLF